MHSAQTTCWRVMHLSSLLLSNFLFPVSEFLFYLLHLLSRSATTAHPRRRSAPIRYRTLFFPFLFSFRIRSLVLAFDPTFHKLYSLLDVTNWCQLSLKFSYGNVSINCFLVISLAEKMKLNLLSQDVIKIHLSQSKSCLKVLRRSNLLTVLIFGNQEAKLFFLT